MQRPTSVTVLGVLNLVFGGFGLLRAFLSLALAVKTTAQFAAAGTVYWGQVAGYPAGLAGILMLMLSLTGSGMELGSGIGLLRDAALGTHLGDCLCLSRARHSGNRRFVNITTMSWLPCPRGLAVKTKTRTSCFSW